MKEFCKNILKRLHLYHPLQSFYRGILFSARRSKYRKAYKEYKGSGYTCNVCGSMYSQFIPDEPSAENANALWKNHVIAGYGKNILCPYCLSTARNRLVICMLEDRFDISGRKILHLSPEKEVYDLLRAKADVITADLFPGFYKNIDGLVQKQDATGLDFKENSFDIVIANHILEHIHDDRKTMKEIFRVLKPGGRAVLQVPFSKTNTVTIESPEISDPVLQSKLYGQKDHVRIYALNDYAGRLRQAGFVVELIPYEEMKAYYKYAIQEEECFYMISKPV